MIRIKEEHIEESAVPANSPPEEPRVESDDDDIDETELLELPSKHYEKLAFPPGCPVVRTRIRGSSIDISFGVVSKVFINVATAQHVYRLDNNETQEATVLCKKVEELSFARHTPVWLTVQGGGSPSPAKILHSKREANSQYYYSVQLTNDEGKRYFFLPASTIKFRPEQQQQQPVGRKQPETASRQVSVGNQSMEGSAAQIPHVIEVGREKEAETRPIQPSPTEHLKLPPDESGRKRSAPPSAERQGSRRRLSENSSPSVSTLAVSESSARRRQPENGLRRHEPKSSERLQQPTRRDEPDSTERRQGCDAVFPTRRDDGQEPRSRVHAARRSSNEQDPADRPLAASRTPGTRRADEALDRRDSNYELEEEPETASDEESDDESDELSEPISKNKRVSRIIVLPKWATVEKVKDHLLGPGGKFHKQLVARMRCKIRLRGTAVDPDEDSTLRMFVEVQGKKSVVDSVTDIVIGKVVESVGGTERLLMAFELATQNKSFSGMRDGVLYRKKYPPHHKPWFAAVKLDRDFQHYSGLFIGDKGDAVTKVIGESGCLLRVNDKRARPHIAIHGDTAASVAQVVEAAQRKLLWCRHKYAAKGGANRRRRGRR